jgi:hypothetical protein
VGTFIHALWCTMNWWPYNKRNEQRFQKKKSTSMPGNKTKNRLAKHKQQTITWCPKDIWCLGNCLAHLLIWSNNQTSSSHVKGRKISLDIQGTLAKKCHEKTIGKDFCMQSFLQPAALYYFNGVRTLLR